MEVNFKVQRFDPESTDLVSHYQNYQVEMTESSTVLDGLIKIREEDDGTLSLRCSCRAAICGSCAMRINGEAGLACNTKIVDVIPSDGSPITIEPAGNLPVIKDLIVDFQPFWSKFKIWSKKSCASPNYVDLPEPGDLLVPSAANLSGYPNLMLFNGFGAYL